MGSRHVESSGIIVDSTIDFAVSLNHSNVNSFSFSTGSSSEFNYKDLRENQTSLDFPKRTEKVLSEFPKGSESPNNNDSAMCTCILMT